MCVTPSSVPALAPAHAPPGAVLGPTGCCRLPRSHRHRAGSPPGHSSDPRTRAAGRRGHVGRVWGQPSPGARVKSGPQARSGAGWGTHHALAAGAPSHEAFAVAVPTDGVTRGAARHCPPRVTPARCPPHAHVRGARGPQPVCFMALLPRPTSNIHPSSPLPSPSLHPFSYSYDASLRPSPLLCPRSCHPHPSITIRLPPSVHAYPSHPHSSITIPSFPIPPTSPLHPHPIPPPTPSLAPSSRWQPCGSPWLRP